MGRELEILASPPCHESDYDARLKYIVAEYAPHPLIEAARAMTAEERSLYPSLCSVDIRSLLYIDESLWLCGSQIFDLLQEFQAFIQHHPITSDNLLHDEVLAKWVDGFDVNDFLQWTEKISELLLIAYQNNYSVHLIK